MRHTRAEGKDLLVHLVARGNIKEINRLRSKPKHTHSHSMNMHTYIHANIHTYIHTDTHGMLHMHVHIIQMYTQSLFW